jgi:hypothetical protein
LKPPSRRRHSESLLPQLTRRVSMLGQLACTRCPWEPPSFAWRVSSSEWRCRSRGQHDRNARCQCQRPSPAADAKGPGRRGRAQSLRSCCRSPLLAASQRLPVRRASLRGTGIIRGPRGLNFKVRIPRPLTLAQCAAAAGHVSLVFSASRPPGAKFPLDSASEGQSDFQSKLLSDVQLLSVAQAASA